MQEAPNKSRTESQELVDEQIGEDVLVEQADNEIIEDPEPEIDVPQTMEVEDENRGNGEAVVEKRTSSYSDHSGNISDEELPQHYAPSQESREEGGAASESIDMNRRILVATTNIFGAAETEEEHIAETEDSDTYKAASCSWVSASPKEKEKSEDRDRFANSQNSTVRASEKKEPLRPSPDIGEQIKRGRWDFGVLDARVSGQNAPVTKNDAHTYTSVPQLGSGSSVATSSATRKRKNADMGDDEERRKRRKTSEQSGRSDGAVKTCSETRLRRKKDADSTDEEPDNTQRSTNFKKQIRGDEKRGCPRDYKKESISHVPAKYHQVERHEPEYPPHSHHVPHSQPHTSASRERSYTTPLSKLRSPQLPLPSFSSIYHPEIPHSHSQTSPRSAHPSPTVARQDSRSMNEFKLLNKDSIRVAAPTTTAMAKRTPTTVTTPSLPTQETPRDVSEPSQISERDLRNITAAAQVLHPFKAEMRDIIHLGDYITHLQLVNQRGMVYSSSACKPLFRRCVGARDIYENRRLGHCAHRVEG